MASSRQTVFHYRTGSFAANGYMKIFAGLAFSVDFRLENSGLNLKKMPRNADNHPHSPGQPWLSRAARFHKDKGLAFTNLAALRTFQFIGRFYFLVYFPATASADNMISLDDKITGQKFSMTLGT
ncbi:MAG: hypothetical protein ACYC2W_04425 [Desulfurivibrionaceae bacterium]